MRVLPHVRLSQFPAGASLSFDDADEIRVVVLGAVATTASPLSSYSAPQLLPLRAATFRALRHLLVAHVPVDALADWTCGRALRLLRSARPADARAPLVVGISSAEPRLATELQHALADALAEHGTVCVARVAKVERRLDLTEHAPPATFQVVHFAEPEIVPPADRWLHVVDGAHPPGGRPMPRTDPGATAEKDPIPVLRGEAGLAPCTLIVAHDRGTRRPRQTARHLAFHRPGDHRHWRRGHAGDARRIARELAGVPIGFALGAGGARGFAHLGVLRAAEESRVPVDYLSGTSIGAVMGALVGMGYDAATRREAGERLARARPFDDFTLPTTSLLRGKRFEKLATEFFAGVDLADLWIPCVTMTCELGDFQERVHREGPLDASLLAGCALPGVPPRVLDGELHVDGGTSDMLPVRLLRASMPGSVVAVDVSPWAPIDVPRRGGYPFGAGALVARLRGDPAPLDALQVFWRAASYNVAARARTEGASADLLITPALAGVGTSDVRALADAKRQGLTQQVRHFAAAAPGFADEARKAIRRVDGRCTSTNPSAAGCARRLLRAGPLGQHVRRARVRADLAAGAELAEQSWRRRSKLGPADRQFRPVAAGPRGRVRCLRPAHEQVRSVPIRPGGQSRQALQRARLLQPDRLPGPRYLPGSLPADGLHDHCFVHVPSERDSVVFVGFLRDGRPFDEREKELLARLQPHLANGRRLALALTAMEDTPAAPELFCKAGFTGRESDVLFWLTRGKSNEEISRILGLRADSVSRHLQSIYAKVGVEHRVAAMMHAVRLAQRLHAESLALESGKILLSVPVDAKSARPRPSP